MLTSQMHAYRGWRGAVYTVRQTHEASEPQQPGWWAICCTNRFGRNRPCPGMSRYMSAEAAYAELLRLARDNGMEDLGPAAQLPTEGWNDG